MAEVLHKTLEEINQNLEKLDAIQTTNLKSVEMQQQKSAATALDHRKGTSLDLTDLKKANVDLQAKVKEIEDKKHTRDGKI